MNSKSQNHLVLATFLLVAIGKLCKLRRFHQHGIASCVYSQWFKTQDICIHIAHTMLAANPGWESKAQDLRIRNCVFLSSDKLVGSAKFVLTQRAK